MLRPRLSGASGEALSTVPMSPTPSVNRASLSILHLNNGRQNLAPTVLARFRHANDDGGPQRRRWGVKEKRERREERKKNGHDLV